MKKLFKLTTLRLTYLLLAILGWSFSSYSQCGESAGSDETICFNQLPISFSTPSNTSWSGTGISSSGLFNPGVDGTFTITLTTDDGVCLDTDEKVVTVLPSPEVNAGTDQLVCVFQSFQINATATSANGNIVVWSWSGDDEYLSSTNIPNPVATPEGSSSFNLTVADEAGCFSFDQINLTTAELPDVNAGVDFTMCHTSDPQILIGTPSGGTWSGPGVSSNQFISPGVGTHTLAYEYTDPMGCTNTDQKSITVTNVPSVEAGDDVTLCSNEDPIQLIGYFPSSGGTWSGAGIVGSSDIFDPSGLDGDITLTYSTGSGTCYNEDTRIVTVKVSPEVTALSDYHFCHGDSDVHMHDFEPSGGHWTGSVVTDISTGAINTGSASADNQVRYVYHDGITGCSDTLFTEVHIEELPDPQFTLESLACSGTEVEITNTSSSSLSFSWKQDGVEFSVDNSPSLIINTADTYGISLTATDDHGCSSDSNEEFVEVIDAPTAHFETDVTEGCEPLDVVFTNMSEGQYVSYSWDFEVSNSLNDSPGTINFGDVTENTTFTSEVEVSNVCGTSAFSMDITSKAIPIAEFHTEISTICSPVFTEFFNTSSSNSVDFAWDLGDGETVNDEVPNDKIYTTENASEIFEIELTASNECGSHTISHELEVLPNPVSAGISGSFSEACAPIDLTLESTAAGATSITYDFGDFTVEDFNTIQSFIDAGTYEIKQYATDGCGFDTTSIEVVVYPAPISELLISNSAFCTGLTVDFETSGEPLVGHTWNLGSGGPSLESTPSITFNSVGNEIITLSAFTAENNCLVEFNETIEVFPLPFIDFELSSSMECAPAVLSITNFSTDATDFEWDFGTSSSLGFHPEFDLVTPGVYDLSVTASNDFGCSSSSEYQSIFMLNETPEADFEFYPNEGHILTSPEITFDVLTEDITNQSWIFGDGNSSIEVNPMHEYTEAGLFPVMLTVENQFGCSSSLTMGVHVKDEFSLFVPNSFTPNGDGVNDVFKPVVEGTNYVSYSFKVFDRWGKVIFESIDPTQGWIGNINEGSHYVMDGVYSWEIAVLFTGGQGREVYTGSINVFR